MKRSAKEVLWLLFFALMMVVPLLIMALAPRPAGRQFWRDIAVALGFVGFALMGLQFIPTGRLPFLAEVFPLDTVYKVHHETSKLSFLLILLHPILLVVQNPYNFVAFNLVAAPWRLRIGVLALMGLVVIVATSVWRQWLRISYERWRLLHDIFAVAIAAMALYHIFKVGYYTSQPVQRWLWIAYAVIWAGMLLYIRVAKPWMLLQRPFEVVDIVEERGKTWSLVVEPVDHAGMAFKAGQVAWLSIGHSPFEIEEHPFSFTSSAEHPERLAFAIRELGDFTSGISALPMGTKVYIDGPYGTFDLAHHPGSGYIFIAGGIGSAPIMSMLRTMAERGDDRQVHFFYGNRTWEGVTFREELAELESKLDLEMIHVVENPPEGWEGELGFITQEVLHRHVPFDCTDCIYFICGPMPMIRLVRGALHALNIPENRIYSEQYEMA